MPTFSIPNFTAPAFADAFPAAARLHTIIEAGLKQRSALVAACETGLDGFAGAVDTLTLYMAKCVARQFKTTGTAADILNRIAYAPWSEFNLPDPPNASAPAELAWELRCGIIALIAHEAQVVIAQQATALLSYLATDTTDAAAAIATLSETPGTLPTQAEYEAWRNPPQ